MYKFGEKSREKRKTLHPLLKKILDKAIKTSPVDFAIVDSYRPPYKQFGLFKKGRVKRNYKWMLSDKSKIVTKVDGYKKVGKHNVFPSEAGDIKVYFHTKPHTDYRTKALPDLYFLLGYIQRIADEMGIKIRLGCKWDRKNIRSNKFMDAFHIEVIIDSIVRKKTKKH